jgi:hypothetical protein
LTQTPRFTVALAAIDDYLTIEQVHLCLEGQSIRGDLEIQFICRSKERLALPQDFSLAYPDIVIIEGGEGLLLNEARALGVNAARAPYVLILEDHCLPRADCLEIMLGRLEEGWSAVGPGFVSGNSSSPVGIAANLLTYGEWMGYRTGEPREYIAGFNSAFPTALLRDRGGQLVEDMVTPSTLQQHLARNGHRFWFEPTAVMAHWESSNYHGVRQILMKNGRGMGMLRARGKNVAWKIMRTLLSPALAAYRCLRGARTRSRVGDNPFSSLLHLAPLSVLWTLGELQGCWSRDREKAIEGSSEVERNRQRFVDGEREPIRKSW